MKSITKLISKSLFAITLMFATSFAANAGLINIKQDIIGDFYGKIGSIEIQIERLKMYLKARNSNKHYYKTY